MTPIDTIDIALFKTFSTSSAIRAKLLRSETGIKGDTFYIKASSPVEAQELAREAVRIAQKLFTVISSNNLDIKKLWIGYTTSSTVLDIEFTCQTQVRYRKY